MPLISSGRDESLFEGDVDVSVRMETGFVHEKELHKPDGRFGSLLYGCSAHAVNNNNNRDMDF